MRTCAWWQRPELICLLHGSCQKQFQDLNLIGIHKMHSRMYSPYTPLLAHDPFLPLPYPKITHSPPLRGNDHDDQLHNLRTV